MQLSSRAENQTHKLQSIGPTASQLVADLRELGPQDARVIFGYIAERLPGAPGERIPSQLPLTLALLLHIPGAAPRLPADHAELDMAVPGEAVFEGVL